MKAIETREDRERLVFSLGLPADAEAPIRYIDGGGEVSGPGLATLVDADVAKRTWQRWYPAQSERLATPAFRAAFEALLSAGVGMGYRLDRFRSACQELPDPDLAGDGWVEPFESAVVARNALNLRVYVRPEIRDSFKASSAAQGKDDERWDSMMSMMSDGLFYELGIILPRLELLADESLAPTELFVEINDARLPRTWLLPSDRALVNDTVDRLRLINVRGDEAVNPANGTECAIVERSDIEICKQAGLTTWSQMGHAVLSISAVARRMAGAFINRHLVDFYCDKLAEAMPTVVEEMKRAMSPGVIAQVLRALIAEEISIRNLLRVFEVLSIPEAPIMADLSRDVIFRPPVSNRSQFFGDTRRTPVLERYLLRVRSSMTRYISYKYTRGSNSLIAYLIDPALEKRLTNPRAFSSADHAELLGELRKEFGSLPATAQSPVILTADPARFRLRREIAAEFPRVAVLSYQELNPDLQIQPIARIMAPWLTDMFARLSRPEWDVTSPVTLLSPPGDPLVRTLLSERDRIVAAASQHSSNFTEPLLRECLAAIIGELAGNGVVAQLAHSLPDRADVPVAWERVVELVLDLAGAASGFIAAPPDDRPQEFREFYAELARVRVASHALARAIADAALVRSHRSDTSCT